MMSMITRCALVATLLLVAGCGSGDSAQKETAGTEDEQSAKEMASAERTNEPDFVTVQHILIGYEGSIPGKGITRTKEEAEQLAREIFDRARSGEDFDALVKEYTDDSHPGIYMMANHGVQIDASQQTQRVFQRGRMVAAFGDVGFPLEVGGIGLAEHDPQKSPYGWHIIKRLE